MALPIFQLCRGVSCVFIEVYCITRCLSVEIHLWLADRRYKLPGDIDNNNKTDDNAAYVARHMLAVGTLNG